jgi:hypothetical protein
MRREDTFYWAAIVLGAAMYAAFVFGVRDPWLLVFGTVLALYGSAHGTLRRITANRDGLVAQFQVQAIRQSLRRRGIADEVATITESIEATVTRGATPPADAALSPAEFVEVLDAVSATPSAAGGTGTAHDATVEKGPTS